MSAVQKKAHTGGSALLTLSVLAWLYSAASPAAPKHWVSEPRAAKLLALSMGRRRPEKAE